MNRDRRCRTCCWRGEWGCNYAGLTGQTKLRQARDNPAMIVNGPNCSFYRNGAKKYMEPTNGAKKPVEKSGEDEVVAKLYESGQSDRQVEITLGKPNGWGREWRLIHPGLISYGKEERQLDSKSAEEINILWLRGYSDKKIANTLGMTPATVRLYRQAHNLKRNK